MEKLAELLTHLEALKEAEGDFNIGLDLELTTLIGNLLEVRHDFEQLTIASDASGKDLERARKRGDELQSSCDALSRTISEQSETLTNRAKVVADLELQVSEQQKIVVAARANIEAKEKAMLETVLGESITPQQFADSLDLYSLAVARISSSDAHPQIVVALVQMAMHMRNLENMGAVIAWLRGAR